MQVSEFITQLLQRLKVERGSFYFFARDEICSFPGLDFFRLARLSTAARRLLKLLNNMTDVRNNNYRAAGSIFLIAVIFQIPLLETTANVLHQLPAYRIIFNCDVDKQGVF